MSLFDNTFASKNAASARAWATLDEDKKKEKAKRDNAPKTGICDKCHKEALVKRYRSRQADMTDGAASFGVVYKNLCDDCAPKSRRDQDADVPAMSKKDVRNLLRGARKGLL
ncbi:MAG: hypothetical protein HUK21_09355 [Fibrobacteraceae bacterium]|nr:hypothetical protein [Fibrobacteraceae bacterium]